MSSCGKQDHCCWFWGKQCKYLTESKHSDFKWSCSLRVKHNSWDEVHKSEDYIRDVRDKMQSVSPGGKDCGDWPTDRVCNTCGERGK